MGQAFHTWRGRIGGDEPAAMMPRLKTGKGVTGCIRYVLGEGRDPKTGEPLAPSARRQQPRGMDRQHRLRLQDRNPRRRRPCARIMEFAALNQKSRPGSVNRIASTSALSWARGETPNREEVEATAHEALDAHRHEECQGAFHRPRRRRLRARSHRRLEDQPRHRPRLRPQQRATASSRNGRSNTSANTAASTSRAARI